MLILRLPSSDVDSGPPHIKCCGAFSLQSLSVKTRFPMAQHQFRHHTTNTLQQGVYAAAAAATRDSHTIKDKHFLIN